MCPSQAALRVGQGFAQDLPHRPVGALLGTWLSAMSKSGCWEHVILPVGASSHAVAVCKTSSLTPGCLWELRQFYEALFRRPLNKWLCGHGRRDQLKRLGGGSGDHMVAKLARIICPSLRPVIQLGQKQAAQAKDRASPGAASASHATLGEGAFQETMVSLGWLLPFLLLGTVNKQSNASKRIALLLLDAMITVAMPDTVVFTWPHHGEVTVQLGQARAPSTQAERAV